jgi:hypothetical protein
VGPRPVHGQQDGTEDLRRVSNGLPINEPLQTLYQLMCAKMPSAMKQYVDQVSTTSPHANIQLINNSRDGVTVAPTWP